MIIHDAEQNEVNALARIWYDGWQDAHAEILPTVLRLDRTLASFALRLQ